MRLIDADAIVYTHEVARSLEDGHNWNELCVTQDDIEDTPTIDAVEVVRCKDCKHRFNGEHHDNCCDVLMEKVKWTFEVTVEPDWFCADGKRRNDG